MGCFLKIRTSENRTTEISRSQGLGVHLSKMKHFFLQMHWLYVNEWPHCLYFACTNHWATAWLFSFSGSWDGGVFNHGFTLISGRKLMFYDCFTVTNWLNWSKDLKCSKRIDSNWVSGNSILDTKWKNSNVWADKIKTQI